MTDKKIIIPSHANKEAHKKVMARLRELTAKGVFQTIVDAGIYNQDGSLTEEYGGEPSKESDESSNLPLD